MKRYRWLIGTFIVIGLISLSLIFWGNNKNVFDIKTGSKYNSQMQLKENKNTFKYGEEVYYTISSKNNIKEDMNIKIRVENANNHKKIQEESFKIKKGTKFNRPINPILVAKKTKYKIQVLSNNKVINEKKISIS